MSGIVDDKSEHCVPFILQRLETHRKAFVSKGAKPPPFFVGLNGVQGAGKTTLVKTLENTLWEQHRLRPLVLSIDDLYLPHSEQQALAKSRPDNPLVQHRGQPGTHDVRLGIETFDALAHRRRDIRVPQYDKSAFNGVGDRVPPKQWERVNRDDPQAHEQTIDVVIFEGWCVGFRPLGGAEVERKWNMAKQDHESYGDQYKGVLGKLNLESPLFVDQQLEAYDALTDDAEDTQYVYEWRLQQEAAMRNAKGRGMTDEQVVDFVNGYYPAYELYTDVLRSGIFRVEKGKQLRLVVDKDRKVTEVHRL